MPRLIDHIDKIARDKQRDVLYLMFSDASCNSPEDFDNLDDFQTSDIRQTLLQWFDDNKIAVKPCAGFAHDGLIEAYAGQLYIDVPYDRHNPDYQKIEALLENADAPPEFPV